MRRAALVALCLLLPGAARAYAFIATDGCAKGHGVAWPERLLPTTWTLNEDGYPGAEGLPLEDVRAALERGITAWQEPCCSTFRSRYGGTTPATALSGSDAPNVVSFRTSGWSELGLGTSTIAVTWPQWTATCELIGADILFNAVTFDFHVDGGDTDLQSIATHEFGHWLGLGHTNVAGATMLATYLGGTGQRSLEQDDVDGLCTLYPGSCGECATAADCPAGDECTTQGACRPLSCDSSSMCPAGSACVNGSCRAGCRADAECAGGEQCLNATCRSSCSICASCDVDEDCGRWGYRCVDRGAGKRCTEDCNVDADCDGDSVCRGAGIARLCMAPGSRTFCPPSYTCHLIEGCPGLWTACSGGCAKGADRCIGDGAGVDRCTCSCEVDADCGPSALCKGGLCMPGKELDPCFQVSCRDDQICKEGRCVPRDPCAGLVCPPDEQCRVDDTGLGACRNPCGSCPDHTVCNVQTLTCDPLDPCEGIICGVGLRCSAGACFDPCGGVSCGPGLTCEDGTCVDAPCTCPEGEVCRPDSCDPLPRPVHATGCSTAAGSAPLAGLLVLLLLRRRRN